MSFGLLALLVPAALARDPNWQVLVHLEVVHAGGLDHPWGVRLGGEWQWAVGDHCEQEWPGWETDCHTSQIWPVAGPGLAITWRGRDRFFFEVNAVAGIASLESATHGFGPRWEVAGRTGFRFRTAAPGAALVMGGFASKSFGLTVPQDDDTTRTYGTHLFGLRFDADAILRLDDDGWEGPVLGAGLWSFASPVYSVYLL